MTLSGLGRYTTRLPNGIDIGEIEVVPTPGQSKRIVFDQQRLGVDAFAETTVRLES